MKIDLAYGQGSLAIDLPEDRVTVIEPAHTPGLADEKQAVVEALASPIGAAPIRDSIKPTDKVAIAFTDITRATPNERIIPWLLEHLEGVVPRENITLINQLGTHRPNTQEELEKMLTPEVVANYNVVNHEPENPDALTQLGVTKTGAPALINTIMVEADIRIVTGFIEPHFFAGFSGGPKGIMPGCAGLETVMANHGYQNLMSPEAIDIVVTTNSGYPLDMNLYQGVKGMSAGARVIKEGGLMILACECREGVPAESPLDKLLKSAGSSEEILTMLSTPGFVRPEQWQAQIQAVIQRKAEVQVHSSLSDDIIGGAHLIPCADITRTVTARLEELGPDAKVAVLPQGPLTIPYLG
jgi:nickel-dependent lactate racemase